MRIRIFVVLIFSTLVLMLENGCRKTVQLNISQIELDTIAAFHFHDMALIGHDTAIIVGGFEYSNGQVLYSFDGMQTWHLKDSVSPWSISTIAALPNKNLYAAGITGRIFHSSNYGKSWDTAQLWGKQFDLKKIIFLKNNFGLAVGNGISSSKGAVEKFDGQSWNVVASLSRVANNVQMLNTQTGYIVAFGAVYKTTDGGNNWNITSAEGDNFTAIYFFDEQHGFVAGYGGTLLETTDGGNSWSTKRNGNSPFAASYQFLDMQFVNETTGYISGNNGLLLKTTDGGNSWEKASYFSTLAVRKIYVQSAHVIWLLGDAATLFKLTE